MFMRKKTKTKLLIKYMLFGFLFLLLMFQEVIVFKILKKSNELKFQQISYYEKYSNNEVINLQNLARIEEEINNLNLLISKYNIQVNGQFIKTSEMENHYFNLLEEEKKKRVDSSGLDLDLERIEKEGKEAFLAGKYQKAYLDYAKLLGFNSSDMNVRFYKMLSLFNLNKSDSSKYKEILTDCKILKENGFQEERIEEIEAFIKQELQ